ncbi:F-box/kelch-repeat protein At1g26930-like [Zingiber officinale]|uniref:F-box/kelch-repeat protein At1g26930-like n=1 Tax=Zingiber officinale TaxID=94328 RepID=UPI001C4BF11A|nr:F-box/kelch-repeat protein At1g26930-like [Zingiber officinale]XP_042382933.1 F-box/kelch-repeat protein At1g26930-like [Zingiber officinale]
MLKDKSELISIVLNDPSGQGSSWDCIDFGFLESSSSRKRPLADDINEEEEEEQGGGDDGDHCQIRKKPQQHHDTPDIQDVQHKFNDSSMFISLLGKDMTINCLLHLSRSYYSTVASLNTSFRSLIHSEELYRLRRQRGVIEHWIYFSCSLTDWEAYDPYRGLWFRLPPMPPTGSFMFGDKESLAVGTDLLVFGKAMTSHIVMRYSILTNSWSEGVVMNSPRCLFASASLGDKAIVAGGTNARKEILDSVELYDSETQRWEILPSMIKARSKCSGAYMDGKFYVIGGMDSNKKALTCGEVYDFAARTWRLIHGMSHGNGLNGASDAPPLLAVVKDELYAAHYKDNEVWKYVKEKNSWEKIGLLPERSGSVDGWGIAFRSCGKKLVVIGGPRGNHRGIVELNSWIPNRSEPEWKLMARRESGNFVYNCAVMSC